MATTDAEDLVALMSEDDPPGAAFVVRPTEHGNRALMR
jgi:hypothetical protein